MNRFIWAWWIGCWTVLIGIASLEVAMAQAPLRVATFDIDATPPIGSALTYSTARSITEPLRCRGLVLLTQEQPIVLVAVDWIGIGNEGNLVFREKIAAVAGTTPDRVAVHTLHQHDAPWCDFSSDALARSHGAEGIVFDSVVSRQILDRACGAIRDAVTKPTEVTHVGYGSAVVERVASNRRVMGPDGRIAAVRWTATKDPAVRAAPVGVIDPKVRSVTLWNGNSRIVVLTYYATHPQSYYGKGDINPDFPGMARNERQDETGVLHVHFCGAGGNIGAGKYNDGSPEIRPILAQRLANGMQRAMASEKRVPILASDVGWVVRPVLLPPTKNLSIPSLEAILNDASRSASEKIYAATQLVWLRRCEVRDPIVTSSLRLGPVRILHLPGELFVEYQLAAAEMSLDQFVAVAAYGDYAPCYIGTDISYSQGGYETEPRASLVAPESEDVLIEAIQDLLEIGHTPWKALGVEAAEREIQAAKRELANSEQEKAESNLAIPSSTLK
ncbi:MAG: hypothetical protein WCI02_09510 [Planctomycetota bacterium]